MRRMCGEASVVVPPGKLRSVITFLEMTELPAGPPPPAPAEELDLRRVIPPDVAFYRHLYNTVGEPWLWIDRRKLSDGELSAIITDPAVELHVLYGEEGLIGYAELDRRAPPDIELAYFGIVPERIGRGFGAFLLRRAVDLAFGYGASRVWLHTCTLDHPNAVDFYRKAGFRPYKTVTELIDDPRLTGLVPREAAPHIPIADNR